MKLGDVAGKISAKILTGQPLEAAIERVYAGDRISDVLDRASNATLLLSRIPSIHLLRVARLMDIPAVCLLGGAPTDPQLVEAANRQKTVLMATPLDESEICRRLASSLIVENDGQP